MDCQVRETERDSLKVGGLYMRRSRLHIAWGQLEKIASFCVDIKVQRSEGQSYIYGLADLEERSF